MLSVLKLSGEYRSRVEPSSLVSFSSFLLLLVFWPFFLYPACLSASLCSSLTFSCSPHVSIGLHQDVHTSDESDCDDDLDPKTGMEVFTHFFLRDLGLISENGILIKAKTFKTAAAHARSLFPVSTRSALTVTSSVFQLLNPNFIQEGKRHQPDQPSSVCTAKSHSGIC